MQAMSITTPPVPPAHDDDHDPDHPQAPKASTPTQTGTPRQTPAQPQPRSRPSTLQLVGQASSSSTQARSAAEDQHLLSTCEADAGRPTDSGVAQQLAGLQRDSMRGEPAQNVDFETAQLPLMQKIAALPPKHRAYYSGAQAQVVNSFELATSPAQRQQIGRGFSVLQKQVDDAYAKTMQDPRQRVQQEFTAPFGADSLGALGKWQSARLQQLGESFARAPSQKVREDLFRQAAILRRGMLQQIGQNVTQQTHALDQAWQASYDRIDRAYSHAQSLQVAHLGELDNTSAFKRLNQFAREAFTSPRDVLAFRDLLQQHPEKYPDLKTWYDDAAKKSGWAHSRMLDDPFERTPNLPDAPQDTTRINIDDLHAGNFENELFSRYAGAQMNLQDNEQMYHAASQRGPIKQEWLTAHTPPKPLWQQQIEDGLGRFVVGLVPGVNLLTPWIVPAKSLPQEWRDGIDFMSGVLGGMMGEAGPEIVGGLAGRMGKLDKAQDELHAHPELRQDADGLRVKDDGPAALHDAGATPHTPGSTYGAGGSAVPAGKALDVPENYATSPAGALKPDPNHPGVWQSPDGLANYIQQDGKTYRVNWSQYRNGWEIRDSVNGSKPTYPAEMGSDGNWKTYANDLGKGGAPPSNYTPELGRQIYTRHQNGETYEQIAQSLGLARSTARLYAHHYANAGNLPIGEVRLQYTPELGEQAYNRHVNGESFRRIGQDLDLSHTTARRYAEQYAKANNLPFGTARWRYTIPLGHEIYTRHQQGEDFKAIAEDLGMNRDTARIYAKQYQAESGALGRPGPSGAAGPSGMSGQAGSSQAAGHPDPRAAGEGGFESLSPEAQQRVDSWIRGEIPAPPELVQLVQRVSGGHWTVVDLYNFMKHRALVPLDKQAQIAAWLRQ